MKKVSIVGKDPEKIDLMKDKINFRMNIWGVGRNDLSEIIGDNYHMILPRNHDINFY